AHVVATPLDGRDSLLLYRPSKGARKIKSGTIVDAADTALGLICHVAFSAELPHVRRRPCRIPAARRRAARGRQPPRRLGRQDAGRAGRPGAVQPRGAGAAGGHPAPPGRCSWPSAATAYAGAATTSAGAARPSRSRCAHSWGNSRRRALVVRSSWAGWI